jgi:ribose transport system substrate-binding protein
MDKFGLSRRELLITGAGTLMLPLIPTIAFAADVPLSDKAKAFGAEVAAMGPAPKPLRLAALSFQSAAFWDAIGEGITEATSYLKPLNTTVEHISFGATLDVESVVAGLNAALAKQYDGIAAVTVFDGTVTKVNEIIDAGVPLIAYVADSAEKSKRTCALGQVAINAGKAAGEFIAKQLDGKGKIAVITGWFGAPQLDDRMNGAIEYLKANAPGITVLEPIENKDDANTAYQQASDLITAHQDLNLIYITGGGPEGAAKAIRDAKLAGKVFVVGYDYLPDRQTYLDNGEMLALVSQDPQRQSFDSLVMLHNILAFGAKYPSDIEIIARMTLGKYAKA